MFYNKVLRDNIDYAEVKQLLDEGAYICANSFPEMVFFFDEVDDMVEIAPADSNSWLVLRNIPKDSYKAFITENTTYKEVQLSDEGLQYLKDNFESFSFLKDR